ncbi:MAG: ribose-5-phosphate isomerase RpiA, partial [Flavisolibacter sp.]
MTAADEIKKAVGIKAAELVKMDMIVGIGTGSTAYWFIEALSQRIKKGLRCTAVPTSTQSADLANDLEIPLTELNDVSTIDLVIDGTDELDHQLCLIKGGGGALLQEKMVASATKHYVIIADHKKLVDHLGAFPLPVEVIPYGWKHVQQRIIHSYNIEARLRMRSDKPYITDHGHYI